MTVSTPGLEHCLLEEITETGQWSCVTPLPSNAHFHKGVENRLQRVQEMNPNFLAYQLCG